MKAYTFITGGKQMPLYIVDELRDKYLVSMKQDEGWPVTDYISKDLFNSFLRTGCLVRDTDESRAKAVREKRRRLFRRRGMAAGAAILAAALCLGACTMKDARFELQKPAAEQPVSK
jgi:hypothetical protein